MVSWDDVFMSKVKEDSPTKVSERHSAGLGESSEGLPARGARKQACRQAQGAPMRSSTH